MVASGISEFTFGFAFLREQVNNNSQDMVAAAILPTLRQEADEGWDACLPLRGGEVYYQFKVAEHIVRRNGRFRQDGTHAGPYYQASLHRKHQNAQHNLLWQLSVVKPDTFYVVSEITDVDTFNAAFLHCTVAHCTRLLPLDECIPITDGEQHHITFESRNPAWWLHSLRHKNEHSTRGSDTVRLFSERRKLWKVINREYVVDLYRGIQNAASVALEKVMSKSRGRRVLDDLPPLLSHSTRSILEGTAFLLSAVFGVTLVIVGEGEQRL